MDFSKIKNSKILKWTLIIGLPTVIVAGYYGFQYYKKKKNEGIAPSTPNTTDTGAKPIDEKDMDLYRIRLPYRTEIASSLSIYLKSKSIPYKFISIKTGMDENAKPILDYNIAILPTDLKKLKDVIAEIGKVDIKKITKEETVVKPIEQPICVVKRNEINSFQEFYESVGCLKYSVLFGYDLVGIKDIKNIEQKVSIDELRKIYNRVAAEKFNYSAEEKAEFTNILKKAYAEN